MQPKVKMIHHEIPLSPWEVLGADIFHFNNKNYLCIVGYHSKFPVIKRMEGLSTESLTPQQRSYLANMGYHVNLCQMLAPISFQTSSKSSVAGLT